MMNSSIRAAFSSTGIGDLTCGLLADRSPQGEESGEASFVRFVAFSGK